MSTPSLSPLPAHSMRPTLLTAAALLTLCAALPATAQRRPVPDRIATAARPDAAHHSTTCTVFVTAPLKVGRVEWWRGCQAVVGGCARCHEAL